MRLLATKETSPAWFRPVLFLGLAWNVFGVFQFLQTVNGSVGSLMANGLTQAQAELYTGLPIWMHAAFAVGVFGGALGCVLMLLKRKAARIVLGVSLVSYIFLFIGDITQGVFAAFGASQVMVLSAVVLIAAGLHWMSGTRFKVVPA